MALVSWLVFGTVSAVLFGVTWWSRRFVKDVAGFMVAGRGTGVWLGLSNNFSGGLGLVSIAYIAQQAFSHGLGYIWIVLFRSLFVMTIFGVFGFGIQRLRASKAMTAGQYHEMRYSRGVRLLVGFVSGIGGVLNMAIFPITGAKFIAYFLGWPQTFWLAGMELNTFNTLAGAMIVAAVFFAVIGGQVGVIVTDYLQSIVIMIGLFTLVFLIVDQAGLSTIRDTLQSEMGDGAFNPLLTGKYGWQFLLWVVAIVWWNPFCFGPVISKNASTRNTKVARVTTLFSAAFGNGKCMIMLILGVGAFVALGSHKPPGIDPVEYSLAAPAIYIHQLSGPLLTGFLLSAFIAAFISTNDTYLLSWAGVWVNDIICPLRNKPLSTRAHLWVLRTCIVVIGCFLYAVGVLYKIEDSVLEFIMMTGTIWLGCGVALVFGLYWRRACTAGAYAAIISSMIIPIVHLVLQKVWPLYKAAVPAKTAGLAAIGVSMTLLIVISLLNRRPTKYVDYSKVIRKDEEQSILRRRKATKA